MITYCQHRVSNLSDPNLPYHNKGFAPAFLWIIILVFIIPLAAMMTLDDTWDRFVKKYTDPWKSNCWENSKHERVCKEDNTCKFGRNFCTPNVYRWREK